jgi:hypothetical protein
MSDLADVAVFFAGFLGGLGVFFIGCGFLWWEPTPTTTGGTASESCSAFGSGRTPRETTCGSAGLDLVLTAGSHICPIRWTSITENPRRSHIDSLPGAPC